MMTLDGKPWMTADGAGVGPGDRVWDTDGARSYVLSESGYREDGGELVEWFEMDLPRAAFVEDMYSTERAAVEAGLAYVEELIRVASSRRERLLRRLAEIGPLTPLAGRPEAS